VIVLKWRVAYFGQYPAGWNRFEGLLCSFVHVIKLTETREITPYAGGIQTRRGEGARNQGQFLINASLLRCRSSIAGHGDGPFGARRYVQHADALDRVGRA
jgi:hypothetical protein